MSVELALALPSVVLVLGFVLAGAAWVRMDIAATQAASTAARVALTDGDAAATSAAQRMSTGSVEVTREGDWIVARVTVPGAGPVPDVEAMARVPLQP
ncbi:TadE family type IV pilus minor pilin [Demequina aurantiaca]|uniref:TadE family type IV pilus minor pilin n=1 Tax=Demequina aurantiaca TaxID=676200 RepID=UPI003D325469